MSGILTVLALDFDHRLHHLRQKFRLGAGSIFGAEFDVVAEGFGVSHGIASLLDDLVFGLVELELAVDGTGCQKYVDAATVAGRGNGLGGGIDVLGDRAGKAGDACRFAGFGHGLYRCKVAGAGDKAGFDDIDTQLL